MRAAQHGDTSSLERLCLKYRAAILAYLRRRGLGDEAEDVAQEVLLGLVQALPRVHATAGRFRSLVFTVARNKAASFLEWKHAAKRDVGRTRPLMDDEAIAVDDEPDDLFDREWLAALVRAALARLKQEQATLYAALKATVLEERPQAQVAREEGVTPATMRKRVWRGRKQVAAYLREEVEAYGLSRRDVTEELRYLASMLGPLRVEADAENPLLSEAPREGP